MADRAQTNGVVYFQRLSEVVLIYLTVGEADPCVLWRWKSAEDSGHGGGGLPDLRFARKGTAAASPGDNLKVLTVFLCY